VPSLRDATLQALEESILPDALRRRARHVVAENDRVLQARRALDNADAVTFGLLMNASHVSRRDDFDVSLPDMDRLVALARSEVGVFGARMTGGGFGGSLVALVSAPRAKVAARHIVDTYTFQGEPRGTVLPPE
jgi:galactokinase